MSGLTAPLSSARLPRVLILETSLTLTPRVPRSLRLPLQLPRLRPRGDPSFSFAPERQFIPMNTDPPDTVPAELKAIHDRLDAVERNSAQALGGLGGVNSRLDLGDRRMGFMERSLRENTDLTRDLRGAIESLAVASTEAASTLKDIRDYQTTARVGGRAIAWIGGLGGGLAGLWAAWKAFKGG